MKLLLIIFNFVLSKKKTVPISFCQANPEKCERNICPGFSGQGYLYWIFNSQLHGIVEENCQHHFYDLFHTLSKSAKMVAVSKLMGVNLDTACGE